MKVALVTDKMRNAMRWNESYVVRKVLSMNVLPHGRPNKNGWSAWVISIGKGVYRYDSW